MSVENVDMNQQPAGGEVAESKATDSEASVPAAAPAAPAKKKPARAKKSASSATAEPKKKRGPGRPPKAASAAAAAVAPKKKRGPGRPPKATSAATATAPKRRGPGRPPKTTRVASSTSVAERERAIKENFKEKLAEAKLEIAQLKNDLKEVVKREVALLKLFDAREKAITKFAETWQKKELAKLQRVAAPKKRRGRPRKASS